MQEVAANMIRAVSNLISEDKRMAWMDLRLQIRMKLVNNLLLALEEMAFLLADVTETPELLEEASDNICKFHKKHFLAHSYGQPHNLIRNYFYWL